MSEYIQGMISILLENIYSNKCEKVADNERIITSINRLKTMMKLPLTYNIKHNLKEHGLFYPVKNCEGEHCFDCLNESISNGFTVCDHDKQLSPYEISHIMWIKEKNLKLRD